MADVPRSVVETLARSLVRKIAIAGSCTTLALRFARLERRSTSQCARIFHGNVCWKPAPNQTLTLRPGLKSRKGGSFKMVFLHPRGVVSNV